MNINKSIELFTKAKTLLPGGVDSPVRAFNAVGGQPLFIEKGAGAHIYDVDGNRYIDYVLSWGPLILGHAHPLVVESIQKAASLGTSYGAPSPLELDLAELVMELMPNIEMLRFVNSGTEATMTALRLARAYTKREKLSSLKVIITVMPICCSCKLALVSQRSACPTLPVCLLLRQRIRL